MADHAEDICFPDGQEAALKEARAAGKPLLLMKNLNELAKDPQGNKALAAEAMKDIPGFLRRHFYLTPLQERQLKSLPASKLDEMAGMLRTVAERGGTARFSVDSSTEEKDTKTKEGSFEISAFGVTAKAQWKTTTTK